MTSRSVSLRTVAMALIVTSILAVTPVSAGPRSGSLSGHVLAGSTRAPLAGALVHVKDPRTGTLHSSGPTDRDGSFSVPELPPSTYRLAIQSGPGLYLAGDVVRLAPGENRTVQVAVTDEPAGAAPGPEEAEKEQARSRLSWLNNPLMATVTVLGAAIFVGVIVDNAIDDEVTASPSSP